MSINIKDSHQINKPHSLLLEHNLEGLSNNKILDYSLPILILATRLSKTKNLDSEYIANIKEIFVSEILTISSNLGTLNIYEDKDLIKLRYCLCVFIDEMLLRNESFINSQFAHNTLTIRLFDEMLGGDKFYDIAGQWLLSPNKYKDMLEFIYACIVLGYKGKYALDAKDKDKIDRFCNDIALAIAPVLDTSENKAFELAYKNTQKINLLDRWRRKYLKPLFIFGVIGVVIVVFLFSYLKLESHNNIVHDELMKDIKQFIQ